MEDGAREDQGRVDPPHEVREVGQFRHALDVAGDDDPLRALVVDVARRHVHDVAAHPQAAVGYGLGAPRLKRREVLQVVGQEGRQLRVREERFLPLLRVLLRLRTVNDPAPGKEHDDLISVLHKR